MSSDPRNSICRDLWGYPAIELQRPRIRTCCKRPGEIITSQQLEQLGTGVFLNLPSVVEERQQSMAGQRVSRCDVCWRMEDQGLHSFRTGELDWQFHFNNVDGHPIEANSFRPFDVLINQGASLAHSDRPHKLDLTLGTHCDQKCIYCTQDYSTLWESENKRFGKFLGDPDNTPLDTLPSINSQTLDGYYDRFIEWFDEVYPYLERIALLGGEPTYSPLFQPLSEHVISRLRDRHHPDCTLSIVTNLNWRRPVLDQILHIKEQLPGIRLVIEASMESHGLRAEYIRNGVSYDRFTSNLRDIALHSSIDISLITTLNALCVSSLLDYLRDVREIEIATGRVFKVIPNRLIKPVWLGTDILDHRHGDYVRRIRDWLLSTYGDAQEKAWLISVLEEVIRAIELPRDDEVLGYFTMWINEMDRRRGTDFAATFPELAHLLSEGAVHMKRSYMRDVVESWEG